MEEFKHSVSGTCIICGEKSTLHLSVEEVVNYSRWRRDEGNIQELLSSLNPLETKFLITGMCVSCQKKNFHTNCEIRQERWDSRTV